ncbi:MAG: hypothetical protein GXP54_08720 [Deltaproteobacteria bacterium]|nr:hypothetical protein [Deltaproteobacteria bacterium]
MQTPRLLILTVGLVALSACSGGEVGTGTLSVTIYGENYIENGIPPEVFVDGWAIDFDQFLITVEGISVAKDASSMPVLETAGQQIFDLTEHSNGAGHQVAQADGVDATAYGNAAYRVAPAKIDALAGNASLAQVEAMVKGGWSMYLEGSATKGSKVVTFHWGFKTATDFTDCASTARVEPDGTGTVQLTIHADHLFFDSLVSTTPDDTFDLIAAADDGDGEITADELSNVDITTLANYQVGNADVTNLWDFLKAQTHTMGHIDGEGHCHIIVIDSGK